MKTKQTMTRQGVRSLDPPKQQNARVHKELPCLPYDHKFGRDGSCRKCGFLGESSREYE